MMRKLLTILCLLWAAFMLQGQIPAPATALPDKMDFALADTLFTAVKDSLGIDEAKQDSLFYLADRVFYEYERELIWLYGNPQINYQDSEIIADSLLLDLKTDRAYSFGPTRMRDGEQLLIGSNVRYDVSTQTGILEDGQSMMEKGYYNGSEIRKTDSDIYDIDNGRFTSCDLAEPSYWFWSKKLRVYRGDKIVGKPVVAYVNHFPVFYFPFITIPIRRGRHAGFLIPEPGYNSVDGKYLREIGWYFPYKDYADFVAYFDLNEKTGWKAQLNTNYIRRYHYYGRLDATYQRGISSEMVNNDWALQGNHHQDLPNKASLDANLDFISNKRIWQSSNDINQSLAQRLTSSVAYRQTLGSSYLNAGSVFTQDLVNDNAYVNLPSASFSLSTRPLVELFDYETDGWLSNLNYGYSVRLDHTGMIREKGYSLGDVIWDNTVDPADTTGLTMLNEHHIGIKHSLGMAYNWKYRGWLNFRQGIDYSESWMDRDKKDEKFVRGYDWSAYANSSFNIYGMRNYSQMPFTSIRHIMTPSVGLSYQPDSRRNADLYSFGSIGARSAEKAASLNYSLDHKWQLKYGSKSNEKKLNDLFTFNTRGSASLYKKDRKLGSFSHTASFRPGSFKLGSLSLNPDNYKLGSIIMGYGAQLSMQQNPYKVHWENLNLTNMYFSNSLSLAGTAVYRKYFPEVKNKLFDSFDRRDSLSIPDFEVGEMSRDDSWNLVLSHDMYAQTDLLKAQSNSLRMSLSCKITDNWSLSYSNYYNLKEKEMLSQSFHLIRNLHCWKIDVSINRRNEYWDYRMMLFNVLLPDALKFQTRDSKKY